MLRVVNQGDAVPRVPLGPLYGGRWCTYPYLHRGLELEILRLPRNPTFKSCRIQTCLFHIRFRETHTMEGS